MLVKNRYAIKRHDVDDDVEVIDDDRCSIAATAAAPVAHLLIHLIILHIYNIAHISQYTL